MHAFVVPIRDEIGNPLSGIRTEDNGQKLGLNGVDNGRLWFDHVRVPRAEMLDKFAQVAADGTYTSSISSPAARFFTTLGTLVAGRISVGHSGLSIAKCGLAIAVRYGERRRQFGPTEGHPETILLDYPAHQRRLMPLLANAYALDFAFKDLTRTALGADPANFRQVETTAAGLKAFSTWNTTHTLQTAREACGGEGLSRHQSFRRVEGRQRYFRDVRGRQHRAHAARRQEPPDGFRRDVQGLRQGPACPLGNGAETQIPAITFARGQRAHRPLPRGGNANLSFPTPRGAVAALGRGAHPRPDRRQAQHAVRRVHRRCRTSCSPWLTRTCRAPGVLERFTAGIAACPDAGLRPILTKLRDLFALLSSGERPRVVLRARDPCRHPRSRASGSQQVGRPLRRKSATRRLRWWMRSASRRSASPRLLPWTERLCRSQRHPLMPISSLLPVSERRDEADPSAAPNPPRGHPVPTRIFDLIAPPARVVSEARRASRTKSPANGNGISTRHRSSKPPAPSPPACTRQACAPATAWPTSPKPTVRSGTSSTSPFSNSARCTSRSIPR